MSAAKEFVMTQSKLQGPGSSKQLFGISLGTGGRSDADIANVVPDNWKEGKEYFRSSKLSFTKGEIVVAFRSDGSRRFGKIIQVRERSVEPLWPCDRHVLCRLADCSLPDSQPTTQFDLSLAAIAHCHHA
jgi:hypothetical protein